jgi:hypothetical protein
MTLGALATNPTNLPQSTSDTIPYGVDCTNAISTISGGSVSSPVTKLFDMTAQQTITLQDSPTLSGNIVTQIVRGSVLTANHQYRLSVQFTAATSTVLTVFLEIDCIV